MSAESTQAIEDAASAWLMRRDSSSWTAADAARLEEWLSASSLHRVAFWRLELAWDEAARLKALGAGVAGHQPPPRGEWNLTPFFESSDQKPAPDNGEGVLKGVGSDGESAEGGVSLASIGRKMEAASLLPAPEWEAKPRRWLRASTFAAAASLVLAVAGGVYYSLKGGEDRYATPVGGIASVPLRDGAGKPSSRWRRMLSAPLSLTPAGSA